MRIIRTWILGLLLLPSIALYAQSTADAPPAGAPSANAEAAAGQAAVQFSAVGQEVRLKDIARIEGLKENQLTGLGLVTGLNGQGDSAGNPLLQYVLASLVGNLGVNLSPEAIKSKNAAVVTLSVLLPPFARKGETVDVQVASLGDAKSLEGGLLLQSPLMGANGRIYAVAQGRVAPLPGKTPLKTTGLVASGALIEEEFLSSFFKDTSVSFLLNNPDFSTASAVGKALTQAFPLGQVRVADASRISVTLPPENRADPVDFISKAETLKVVPDLSARVVVNKASGVVVAGRFVRIAKVAVSVKGAKITIGADSSSSSPSVSQDKASEQFLMEETRTVEDLVTMLQQIGLDTDTVIEVLQAIDKAGALYGTLEIL